MTALDATARLAGRSRIVAEEDVRRPTVACESAGHFERVAGVANGAAKMITNSTYSVFHSEIFLSLRYRECSKLFL